MKCYFPVGFLRSDNDAKPLGPNVWCETEVLHKICIVTLV